MELFIFLVIWAGLSFWIGSYAESRGRSMAGFFLLSMLTSPLLGIIVVLLTKDLKAEEAKREDQKREHQLQLEAFKSIATTRAEPDTDSKSCPFCAEPIKKAAIKCRHCGSELAQTSATNR